MWASRQAGMALNPRNIYNPYIYIHTHTHIYIHIYIYAHIYIYIYIGTHIYIYMFYIYMYSHIRVWIITHRILHLTLNRGLSLDLAAAPYSILGLLSTPIAIKPQTLNPKPLSP